MNPPTDNTGRHGSKNRSSRRKPVRRTYKDRLFQFIFRDRKDLLELYNAVSGTDYRDPELLTITTLEDAVFLGMKNDLSFMVSSVLNLYEHQSSWNSNMPLRGLIYFSMLYQEYVEQSGYNLYGSKRIPLPFPNYVVFYNGDSRKPDVAEMALSDAFVNAPKGRIPSVECRVKILNINQGHNQAIVNKCRRLREYTEFIGMIKTNLKNGMEIRPAVSAAMDTCINRGILTDSLTRCRTEVMDMLLTEYDEKATMEYIRKEAEEIGEKRGERRGRQQGLKQGEKRGRQQGIRQGEKRINRLYQRLISTNRFDDLKRAIEDPAYRKKLLQIYKL